MNIKTLKIAVSEAILTIFLLVASFSSQAAIVSFTKDSDGVTFRLDTGLMKIKICSNEIIEVKYTTLVAFAAKSSLVVTNSWNNTPEFVLAKNSSQYTVSTSKLKIIIDSLTNSIKYFDLNNSLILSEDGYAGKKMTAATIVGISTFNCSTQFKSPADEALFGLGCHPTDAGAMNYKGRNQDMAIQYMTGAIPVLLSNKGYGLMWDNYSASNFYGTIASNTKYKYVSESGTMVDYFFFYGLNSIKSFHFTVRQPVRLLCSQNGHMVFFSRRTGTKARPKCCRLRIITGTIIYLSIVLCRIGITGTLISLVPISCTLQIILIQKVWSILCILQIFME